MFIADTHCDTIAYVLRDKCKFMDTYNTSDGQFLQVYAMFCEFPFEEAGEYKAAADRSYMNLERHRDLLALFIKQYYESIRAGEGRILHCGDAREAEKVLSDGKCAAMLSIEGCGFLDELEDVQRIYNCGVRIAGLTWNYNNVIGCGASASGTAEDTGLTSYGRDFVKECERVGIIVDISHASDKTAENVLSITSKPVIASHSNFREVCNCARNLPKEFSDEIVKRGGYIGLNTYCSFVKEGVAPENYTMDMILPHAEYAVKNGYGDNIGFGFDIDGVSGIYPKDVLLNKSIHDQYIEMFKSSGSDIGFIEKIAGRNFLEFLKRYNCAI